MGRGLSPRTPCQKRLLWLSLPRGLVNNGGVPTRGHERRTCPTTASPGTPPALLVAAGSKAECRAVSLPWARLSWDPAATWGWDSATTGERGRWGVRGCQAPQIPSPLLIPGEKAVLSSCLHRARGEDGLCLPRPRHPPLPRARRAPTPGVQAGRSLVALKLPLLDAEVGAGALQAGVAAQAGEELQHGALGGGRRGLPGSSAFRSPGGAFELGRESEGGAVSHRSRAGAARPSGHIQCQLARWAASRECAPSPLDSLMPPGLRAFVQLREHDARLHGLPSTWGRGSPL